MDGKRTAHVTKRDYTLPDSCFMFLMISREWREASTLSYTCFLKPGYYWNWWIAGIRQTLMANHEFCLYQCFS